MGARPGTDNPLSGPRLPGRLPISQPEPNRNPCDLDGIPGVIQGHTGGIRLELRRYDRRVGSIRICGVCLARFLEQRDPDPLFVDGAA